jgi:hypothetical protein
MLLPVLWTGVRGVVLSIPKPWSAHQNNIAEITFVNLKSLYIIFVKAFVFCIRINEWMKSGLEFGRHFGISTYLFLSFQSHRSL